MAHESSIICGITARFQIITPMFLGGADQKESELRGPSIKALLRFWHRAVDPLFGEPSAPGKPIWESRIWGGAEKGAGQSRVLLAVTEQDLQTLEWQKLDRRRFDEGQGRRRKNGIEYLGYPFGFREHADRTAFAPGSTFTLRAVLRPTPHNAFDLRELRVLAASLWMLGHVGALGSRSRRGFGGLALLDWQSFGDVPIDLKEAMDALPLLSDVPSRDAWISGFDKTTDIFRSWFGGYNADNNVAPHPHIGDKMRIRMSKSGFSQSLWPKALNALGRRLQDFRARSKPDYDIAKNHLMKAARSGGSFMRTAPGRVTFGLPLVFRFGSLSTRPDSMLLVPFDGTVAQERHASLLFARLALLSGEVHPLFLRLSGAVPGIDNSVGIRGQGRGGLTADHNALDAFMDSLE